MEKQLIFALVLLIIGIFGISNIVKPTTQQFKVKNDADNDYYQEKFEEFQWKYGKVYNAVSVQSKRFELFKKAMIYIEEFNLKSKDAKLAMNKFGDLTDEEYAEYLNHQEEQEGQQEYSKQVITNRPQKIDWIGTLVNTEVYNQGDCGSCWAFSAIQAFEGLYAKKTGSFKKLSVQELIDCVYPGHTVCKDGGNQRQAMIWIMDNGICAEKDYPFTYQDKQMECQQEECKPILDTFERIILVPSKQPQAVLNHLSIAPLTMGIDASMYVFKFYSNGIIRENPSTKLNHAVVGVGYDESEGYVKIKNSWGDDWGENGYFRVEIGEQGVGPLGAYQSVSYPHYEEEPLP